MLFCKMYVAILLEEGCLCVLISNHLFSFNQPLDEKFISENGYLDSAAMVHRSYFGKVVIT